MSNSLRTIETSKNFAGVQALSGIHLELSEGAILGLIGSNGSGKTTLLNIITGVLQPDSGQVFVGDTEITGWRTDRIAMLGVGRTFQIARLFGSLSVVENVELSVMSAPIKEDIDTQVIHLLDRLNLNQWTSTQASILPYGVQRRLEIARALGIHPRYLLLDEPAAGLNEEEAYELLTIIHGIREDPEFGCGILIIDHNPRLIMLLCDRIHVLDEGKTIAEGTPMEIRRDPVVIKAYLGKQYESDEKVELE
ncbi:MAG: ABC transporter ATP-binding protein [Dehalococcoidia bacterium]|nr:MAG: ABC transporter ATP-binding protein [Dehalococcoidia bacterium]